MSQSSWLTIIIAGGMVGYKQLYCITTVIALYLYATFHII